MCDSVLFLPQRHFFLNLKWWFLIWFDQLNRIITSNRLLKVKLARLHSSNVSVVMEMSSSNKCLILRTQQTTGFLFSLCFAILIHRANKTSCVVKYCLYLQYCSYFFILLTLVFSSESGTSDGSSLKDFRVMFGFAYSSFVRAKQPFI